MMSSVFAVASDNNYLFKVVNTVAQSPESHFSPNNDRTPLMAVADIISTRGVM